MFWFRRKKFVGSFLPLNAVSSSATRATAPPIYHRAMLVIGDLMRTAAQATGEIVPVLTS
jgi:hypothetical protein